MFVCLFVCLLRSSRPAFPNVPIHYLTCPHITYTSTHTLTLYPANLQPSGSPDCVCSKVQLAPLQSTIEHIPCLCFLYRPIKIFPLMASLLQVGEREIVCLDNELTPSPFSSAKHSMNYSNAISAI